MTNATTKKRAHNPEATRCDAKDDQACPNCGSAHDRHEDNGCAKSSIDYTILCLDCGHQWSPNEG
jgi:hypothetical protein